jgi:hypothetical protein
MNLRRTRAHTDLICFAHFDKPCERAGPARRRLRARQCPKITERPAAGHPVDSRKPFTGSERRHVGLPTQARRSPITSGVATVPAVRVPAHQSAGSGRTSLLRLRVDVSRIASGRVRLIAQILVPPLGMSNMPVTNSNGGHWIEVGWTARSWPRRLRRPAVLMPSACGPQCGRWGIAGPESSLI